jgi:hypothetical protein
MASLDAVVGRLAGLEKENARLRRVQRLLAVSVLTIGAVVLLVAASFPKSVEVTDANGTLRSVLFADDDKGKSGLEIRDPGSKTRFSVHTNQADDPYMNFIDKNGKSRIEIGIDPNGEAYLTILDGDGNIRHNLRAAP